MPEEPESITELEMLATLDALGEASQSEKERLREALKDNPELAATYAGMRNDFAALVESAPAEEGNAEVPADVLEALERSRKAAFDEMCRNREASADDEKPANVVSFPLPFKPMWIGLAAAALVALFAVVAMMVRDADEQEPSSVLAHTDALELARNYRVEFLLKNISSNNEPGEKGEDQLNRERLKAHMIYLANQESPAEAEQLVEIFDALPEMAKRHPEFRQLRKKALETISEAGPVE